MQAYIRCKLVKIVPFPLVLYTHAKIDCDVMCVPTKSAAPEVVKKVTAIQFNPYSLSWGNYVDYLIMIAFACVFLCYAQKM